MVEQLTGQNAHLSFENAVQDLEVDAVGRRPQNVPYSIWEQVEHIRIALNDIVEFCVDPDYRSPEWPEGYWPDEKRPAGESEWKQSLDQIRRDMQRMVDLVSDAERDLFEPFPHGDGQTLFREAVLVIDHNAYHTGQIVTIRRSLKLWE